MRTRSFRTFLRRRSLVSLVILLLSALTLAYGIASGIAQESEKKEREIETRIPAHLPIKLKFRNVEKVKDLKNEDWIGDLEVEVTNTGTKPIYYLYIELLVPEVVKDDKAVTKTVGFPLRYGRIQLVDFAEPIRSDDVPLLPGESAVIKVKTTQATPWKSLRAKGRYVNPKKLQFWFELLNYGDGTGFRSPEGLRVPKEQRAEF